MQLDYTCFYSKCGLQFYHWFLITIFAGFIGHLFHYIILVRKHKKINIVKNVTIFNNESAHPYSSEFLGLFPYIVMDEYTKKSRFILNHELTHIRYLHPTINILLITIGSIFDNYFISLFLTFFIRKVISYFNEMYADFKAINELTYMELIEISNFFHFKYQTLLEKIIDFHPSNNFRSWYIYNFAKMKFVKDKRNISFIDFIIESHSNYNKFKNLSNTTNN